MAAHRTRLQDLAFGFCLLFGVVLIAQVQVAGDGMWFWYAVALNHGSHLYRDLHLPLQPLYPLLVAGSLRLLGQGWLIGRLLPVTLMALYALSVRLLVRCFPGSDLQRGIAMLFGFAAPLLFGASRFDDYHVLTDCCTTFSAVLLLGVLPWSDPGSGQAAEGATPRRLLWSAAGLGLLSGLAMTSRLNDGALLALSVFVVLAAATQRQRFAALSLFLAVAALTLICVVALTGDSLHQWANESIFHAASAKGGTGRIMFALFLIVPDAVVSWSREHGYPAAEVCVLALGAVIAGLSAGRMRRVPRTALYGLLALLAGLLLLTAKRWGIANLPLAFNVLAVPAAFGFSVVALYRLLRALPNTLRAATPLLILLPFGQLLSGAMSSGGFFLPLTSALGIFLLLLPIAFHGLLEKPVRRTVYTVVLAAMSLCCFAFKGLHPFYWHNYLSAPLFTKRQWYCHPIYGPMVVEKDLLQLVQPMCTAAAGQPRHELLSLPFPYPNYFCGTPPWHGYVQTFFDISTSETMDRLLGDLKLRPPPTIVYQRQIKVLELHEFIYNHNHRLPQRDLDEFIGTRIDSGAWTVAREQCLGHNDWLTIETRSAPSPPVAAFNSFKHRCD